MAASFPPERAAETGRYGMSRYVANETLKKLVQEAELGSTQHFAGLTIGQGMCRGTFLVEHHFRPRQHLGHDVPIRPVQIATNRFDGCALSGVHPVREQRAQTVFAAVLLQADHLAANQVGEDRPEVLPLAALNLVDAEVPGAAFRPRAIPRLQKRLLRAPGRPPTYRMPHGRVTRRHRLTIEANALTEAPRQTRVRVGKAHPLGADSAVPAPEATQGVAQRHRMLRPRQVVPGARLRVTDVSCPSPAPRTDIAANPSPLELDYQPPVLLTFQADHSIICQSQNPRTIPKRSHRSSLVVITSREDTIQSRMASGIAVPTRAFSKEAGGNGSPSPARRRGQRRSPQGPRVARSVDAVEHGGTLIRRRPDFSNCQKPCIQSSEEPKLVCLVVACLRKRPANDYFAGR